MLSRDAILEFLDERQRAWTERDADALGRGHADSGTVLSPMFATLSGREAITASYHSLFHTFTDWQITNERPIIDGTRVAQPFDATATQTGSFMGIEPSGRHTHFHGVFVFDFTPECLIATERRIYDFTGLLIQVGVLRSKPAL